MQKTVDIVEQMMCVALDVKKEPVEITDKEGAEAALFFALISNAQVVKEIKKDPGYNSTEVNTLISVYTMSKSSAMVSKFIIDNYEGDIKIKKSKWVDAAHKMAEAMVLFEEAVEVE